MVLPALFSALSTAAGLGSAIAGNSSARSQQRAIQNAYNKYYTTQQGIYGPLADQLTQSANQYDQARLNLYNALNSAARTDAANQAAQASQANAAAMQAGSPIQQGTQRSASAQNVAETQGAKTAANTQLAQNLLGAQAAQSERSLFDTQQQVNAVPSQLQALFSGQQMSSLAEEQQALNQLRLQQALGKANSMEGSALGTGLGLAGQLFNALALYNNGTANNPLKKDQPIDPSVLSNNAQFFNATQSFPSSAGAGYGLSLPNSLTSLYSMVQ